METIDENDYETATRLVINSIDDPRWINKSKYQNLVTLICSNMNLTKLPDDLPSSLQELRCSRNQLTSLPEHLPSALTILDCDHNQLTSLPEHLPPCLQHLRCAFNQLSSLPNRFPSSFEELYCSNNILTVLPEHLPSLLTILDCDSNQLTSLPSTLPSSLIELECRDNNIEILPNLPESVEMLSASDNPLVEVYDDVDFDDEITEDDIKKINAKNEKMERERIVERSRLINEGDVLLEVYMKKMMHPDRLRELRDDENVDVDEFMEKYVGSL